MEILPSGRHSGILLPQLSMQTLDVDKFNYLRSLLRGPAREAVSGLTLTVANYDDVLKGAPARKLYQ